VGAYGGKAEIMNAVSPLGKVYQAGTLSGNPLATAAGIATLGAIDADPEFYAKIDRATTRLADGLQAAGRDAGVKIAVPHIGGMSTVFFLGAEDDAVADWDCAARCETAKFAKFFWAMLDAGVYLPCSQFETMFTSVLHDDAIIDATVEKAAAAFKALAK
ncbi:MAG: aminotransferase class III-fold pyridoxal phosphate-dependent enzyme, partial [Thermoguttaceae bacterium]|nr:aminotransferase class III-fold pyridoxal phosphate-dependent enzyme [Thermoguttaceae bacterium]